jgi:hypothetical protein
MQLENKDKYVAGLWHRNLSSELLWSVNDWHKSNSPKEYRAPSWSWAAVDGEVVFEKHRGASLIEILDCDVTTVNNDPFAEVTDGYLRLSGRLYLIGAMRNDCDVAIALFENLDLHIPNRCEPLFPDVFTDVQPGDDPIELYCCPVLLVTERPLGLPPVISCLLLRPDFDREQGVYTRFGTYTTINKNVISTFGSDTTYEYKDFLYDRDQHKTITII